MPAIILSFAVSFDAFLVGFMVLVVAERLYERRYSHQALRGQVKMAWSYTALHVLHGFIYMAAPAEYFWLGRRISGPVTTLGLALFAVSLLLRVVAIRTLGRFWSLHLEIRPEHQLITQGVYRYVRHPAYLAIMLEMISIPLVANSYYTLVVTVVVYIPVLLMRWSCEERELTKKFGERYMRYRKEVPAFLPWRWATGARQSAQVGVSNDSE